MRRTGGSHRLSSPGYPWRTQTSRCVAKGKREQCRAEIKEAKEKKVKSDSSQVSRSSSSSLSSSSSSSSSPSTSAIQRFSVPTSSSSMDIVGIGGSRRMRRTTKVVARKLVEECARARAFKILLRGETKVKATGDGRSVCELDSIRLDSTRLG